MTGRGTIDQDFYRLVGREAELDMLESFAAQRPSRAERMEAGKALRQTIPRSDHASYQPSPQRSDPVSVLEAENATRIQELVPVRMARMLSSPFAFLRGAAGIMASDLSGTRGPASKSWPAVTCIC